MKNYQKALICFVALTSALIIINSCTKEVDSPNAILKADQQVDVQETVEFDAGESSGGCNSCEIIKYYWDWENDGVWDTTLTDPVVRYAFGEANTHNVVLQVRNNQAETDKDSLKIDVQATNAPPEEPTLIKPEKGASEVSVNPTLEWSGSDPDGDPLTYNISLGVDSSLKEIASVYESTEYTVTDTTLEENTTYYWKVEAKDELGEVTASEKRIFTTEGTGSGANPPNPPTSPYPESGDDNRPLNQILSWEASHPNGVPLIYDIYIKESEDEPSEKPEPLEEDHETTSINPSNYNFNLEKNTTYYWLVTAKDTAKEDSSDSPWWHFTTGNNDADCPSEIPYNDTTIQTQKIGTQCWMAENLNHGQLLEPQENPSDNNTTEKYCYNTNENNCEEYGGLYQWDELMGYSDNEEITGICPDGWHIPSEEEWQQLIDHLGGSLVAGKKLKTGGSSGFEALMNGRRDENDAFKYRTEKAFFWTSSSKDNEKALQISINKDSDVVFSDYKSKNRANAVRCIKD
ncbi:MAG: hypothetical protein K9I68_07930 [Bacteroidales bacterium]|nr:hypothetical protein [Bacteroidales bacterium]MCF8338234.1 hypothetical protein [Bacteroidales bacterium]